MPGLQFAFIDWWMTISMRTLNHTIGRSSTCQAFDHGKNLWTSNIVKDSICQKHEFYSSNILVVEEKPQCRSSSIYLFME